jgi:glyceraldehyde 3-phosphate dehydrogenase
VLSLDIDVAIEATGKFNHGDKAIAHIKAGAKKVLLTGPSKGGDVQMIVKGVNNNTFATGPIQFVVHEALLKISYFSISNWSLLTPLTIICTSHASCTTNCIGPVAKVLNDQFGIQNGLMTTVHAITCST